MQHLTTSLEEIEAYPDAFPELFLCVIFKIKYLYCPIYLEHNGNAFLSDLCESILILSRLEFTI